MTNKSRIEQLEKEMYHLKSLVKLQEEKQVVGTVIGEDTIVVTNKPKFEEGWYGNGIVSSFIGYWDGKKYIYGLTSSGNWFDKNSGVARTNEDSLMPTKKIETALIKEAIRIGFKIGVSIRSDWCLNVFPFIGKIWYDGKRLICGYEGCIYTIFEDGKWAKIIESTLKIHGEVMKVEGDIVSFGCAKFETQQIMEYLAIFSTWTESNRKIKSIILDSGKQLTIQDLESIVDYINKSI